MGFGVWGLGFGVWGLGFGGLGFGVWGLGVGAWGLLFGGNAINVSETADALISICGISCFPFGVWGLALRVLHSRCACGEKAGERTITGPIRLPVDPRAFKGQKGPLILFPYITPIYTLYSP